MGIYTGGESTAIDSPRYLTLRHARQGVLAAAKLAATVSDISDKDDESGHKSLNPGEEQLSSYWSPELTAGEHTITVKQTVSADGTTLPLPGKQTFYVEAPQFALPEDSVHSTYPPPAYSEEHRVLPHVVLTDPHLPWERDASKVKKVVGDRNRVPWLALFTFTQDELKLSPDDLDRSKGIFQSCEQLFKPDETAAKQTPTFAVNLTVADLLKTKNVASPVRKLNEEKSLRPKDLAVRGDFIFVDTKLFVNLFSSFDSASRAVPGSFPDISQYQFLSHVRNINTSGMAVSNIEQNGIFSIVIGARSGPLDNPTPVSVAVHLVSIEGVEKMTTPISDPRVALCSLYSWNYTVLPPNQLNVFDAFTAIGATLECLRPSEDIYRALKDSKDPVRQRVSHRLQDGYSLLKYRTQTGEKTVAMYRGPFTPTVVPPLEVNNCTNSGIDLQILDKAVGMIDISYSTAWQLGRTLALGDQAFTAALGRFRSAIRKLALKNAKLEVIKAKSPEAIRSRAQLIKDLPRAIANLNTIHAMPGANGDGEDPDFKSGGPLLRWARSVLTDKQNPSLSADGKPVKQRYLDFAIKAAEQLSMSTKKDVIYDEINTPVSSDWMVILAWLMDRMSLVGVPAHYLINDPSHLPKESLRFFHIDRNWIDAMIDGALSLANHMGFDKDRVAIKHVLNRYISHVPDGILHTPQLPSYGFYLRSDLITMFPDLRVVTLPDPANRRAPLLRHNIISDGVMLCLLDRAPGSPDFNQLVFIQPPHQQRFAIATKLESDEVEVKIRRQYTVTERPQGTVNDYLDVKNLHTNPTSPDNVFVWGSEPGKSDLRLVRAFRFNQIQLNSLNDISLMGTYKDKDGNDAKYFDDNAATSALFALQLNDPNYKLVIDLDTPGARTALSGLDPGSPDDNITADVMHTERASFTPRLLLRTNVIEVKNKLIESSSSEDDDDDDDDESERDNSADSEPDHETLTLNATYERHKDSVAGPSEADAHPPHQTALRSLPRHVPISPRVSSRLTAKQSTRSAKATSTTTTMSLARTSSVASAPSNDPASSPVFKFDMFSNTTVEPRNAVQCKANSAPQDLIISISVTNNADSSYKLQEFAVRLPLGTPTARTNVLFKAYKNGSTGPSMLSNLRFNALAAFDRDPNDPALSWLVVRILPRAARGWINMTTVDDMSVLLSMAEPVVYDVRKQFVSVQTRTYYVDDAVPYRSRDDFVMLINMDKPVGE